MGNIYEQQQRKTWNLVWLQKEIVRYKLHLPFPEMVSAVNHWRSSEEKMVRR